MKIKPNTTKKNLADFVKIQPFVLSQQTKPIIINTETEKLRLIYELNLNHYKSMCLKAESETDANLHLYYKGYTDALEKVLNDLHKLNILK